MGAGTDELPRPRLRGRCPVHLGILSPMRHPSDQGFIVPTCSLGITPNAIRVRGKVALTSPLKAGGLADDLEADELTEGRRCQNPDGLFLFVFLPPRPGALGLKVFDVGAWGLFSYIFVTRYVCV